MEETKENTTKRGRPAKEKEKLTRSINLKLTESDFKTIGERAAKLGMTATQYARQMTLKGKIKSRFTIEELELLRKVAGVANNINQLAKKANSIGFYSFRSEAAGIIEQLKTMLDDCKEH